MGWLINKKTLNTHWFNVFLFVFLVTVDQASKYTAKSPFLNTVFAFSLPLSKIAIYAIYIIVLAIIANYIIRKYKIFLWSEKVAWVFILSGSLSNIAERVWLGYVRDWIYIFNGVLNLADFFIIFGILILFFAVKFNLN